MIEASKLTSLKELLPLACCNIYFHTHYIHDNSFFNQFKPHCKPLEVNNVSLEHFPHVCVLYNHWRQRFIGHTTNPSILLLNFNDLKWIELQTSKRMRINSLKKSLIDPIQNIRNVIEWRD